MRQANFCHANRGGIAREQHTALVTGESLAICLLLGTRTGAELRGGSTRLWLQGKVWQFACFLVREQGRASAKPRRFWGRRTPKIAGALNCKMGKSAKSSAPPSSLYRSLKFAICRFFAERVPFDCSNAVKGEFAISRLARLCCLKPTQARGENSCFPPAPPLALAIAFCAAAPRVGRAPRSSASGGLETFSEEKVSKDFKKTLIASRCTFKVGKNLMVQVCEPRVQVTIAQQTQPLPRA